MKPYLSLLFPVFLVAITIRNVWPQKMGLKAFAVLYVLMVCAALPIPLLTFKQYGLFSVLLVICLYGLITYRDTRPKNICMVFFGCVLAIILDNMLVGLRSLLPVEPLRENPYAVFCDAALQVILTYIITFFCGKLIRWGLLNRKGLLQIQQVWYLIDVALLLLFILFFLHTGVRADSVSTAGLIYYNVLFFGGYLFVAVFLSLSMFRDYREKIQTETRQKAFQDLQDYTRNMEAMYDGLRFFKHDYINILTSLSGYIENGDMAELKDFFEGKILPTKNLITQGDYKLNQLSNIAVLEIKSLLSAKMIYAHEMGIDVTIDIPDCITQFFMDTVDLARILGIFMDNAVEAALEAARPEVGLNIIQNPDTVAVIISNSLRDSELALHKLKEQGFTTKAGHTGIGLANAQRIIRSYDNILWETTSQDGCFTQYLEIAGRKE
ncbi:MAG: GHKL domain-containing protein [Acetatifactor sp.]|nr:GHKL domain-containing protein [Acetatifactor sp.]